MKLVKVIEHCGSQNTFGETQECLQETPLHHRQLIKLNQHSEALQWSEMVGLVRMDVEKEFDALWRLDSFKLNLVGLQPNSTIRWINSSL